MGWHSKRLYLVAMVALIAACDRDIRIGRTEGGGAPASHVPALLPARMLIGIADNDGAWMAASGVAWDVRWSYFTADASLGKGWYNGWTGGALAGTWAAAWLTSAVRQGFLPGVAYYLLEADYPPAGSSGAQILSAKLQVASVMADYFGKFKLFLQVAKQVASPVLVILEGNAMGAIEMQAANDPSIYAAIADSGMPELASLPNTVAGFGLAFLALRKSVGASNVLLGPVIEQLASGDFLYHDASDAVAPHVAYQYDAFMKYLGVGPNATGETFDFVAHSPAYADADRFAAMGDPGFWWDASDTASVLTSSFNRYLQWLTLFNQAAKLPWVLWQVPMGNSNSPNVYNAEGAWAGPYPSGYVLPAGCTPSSKQGCPGGYKDNRAEYWLGDASDAHLSQLAEAGVIGLLFGPGPGCSDQVNDFYSDGQLFMKSRAGALLSRGGFALAR